MCMEDIIIGRESIGFADVKPVVIGTLTPLVGPDPNRIAITFSHTLAFDVWIKPTGVTGTTGGFVLNSARPSITLTLDDVGDLITKDWQGYCVGGAESITVIPVVLMRRK